MKRNEAQYNFAMRRPGNLTTEELHACDMVVYCYDFQIKIDYKYIELIDELIRKQNDFQTLNRRTKQ